MGSGAQAGGEGSGRYPELGRRFETDVSLRRLFDVQSQWVYVRLVGPGGRVLQGAVRQTGVGGWKYVEVEVWVPDDYSGLGEPDERSAARLETEAGR